jgi:hypothetical protein
LKTQCEIIDNKNNNLNGLDFNKDKTISLITGASGFIGSKLFLFRNDEDLHKILDKSIKILIIPFLTPRLSSYWIDLVTPIKASLARPFIDSLKPESTVRDDSILKIIPTELKSFEGSLEFCMKEEKKNKKNSTRNLKKERTSLTINYKILLISLLLLLAIGTTIIFWMIERLSWNPFGYQLQSFGTF